MKLTVIVPCYNEEAALHFFYEEICKVMPSMPGVELELLFVNDGSKDMEGFSMSNFAAQENSGLFATMEIG